MTKNKKWILKKRPKGLVEETNFKLIEEELSEIQNGEILIQTEYLSVDPTQRMWLTDVPGYLPPIQIDEVIRSGGIGRVIESKNERFDEGDLVNGFMGWQTHLISDGKGFTKVPEVLPIPLSLIHI